MPLYITLYPKKYNLFLLNSVEHYNTILKQFTLVHNKIYIFFGFKIFIGTCSAHKHTITQLKNITNMLQLILGSYVNLGTIIGRKFN